MFTECKCYWLGLQSKMAWLFSRWVHTSSVLSWTETVNVCSYNISPGGCKSRWVAAFYHGLLHMAFLPFHSCVLQAASYPWFKETSTSVPFQLQKALQSSLAKICKLKLYISPVLAMHVQSYGVSLAWSCWPPLLHLCSLYPPDLSVRHLNLGTKGRRAEESAAD